MDQDLVEGELERVASLSPLALAEFLAEARHALRGRAVVRAACVRLPEVITDMNPRALVETAVMKFIASHRTDSVAEVRLAAIAQVGQLVQQLRAAAPLFA